MENFTPVSSAIGGALIGLSASLMLLFSGRITGISGILGGLMNLSPGDIAWRLFFLGGLFAGGLAVSLFHPALFAMEIHRSAGALAVAGLLVGFGTRLGNGCTSGHGVCGLSRLSIRSLVATVTFMGAGILTATFITRFVGGSL